MTENTRQLDASTLIACSLGEEELRQRQAVARDLFALAQHVDELPDGYAWRFPGEGDWQARLLDFVAAERRCCGFFRIELSFNRAWVRLCSRYEDRMGLRLLSKRRSPLASRARSLSRREILP